MSRLATLLWPPNTQAATTTPSADDAYAGAGSGELAAFREVAPELVAAEAEALGAALRRVLDRLDEGQRALAVGHSPANEAAVLGLTGQEIGPLGKGEGVRITAADGGFRVVRLT